jgi:hypothetical protein
MSYPNGQSTNQESDKQSAPFQQKIVEQGQEALSTIEDSLKDFQGTMETAARSTVEFVKRYPMQIFIGAAVVGFLVRSIFVSRNTEEV